ncbi:MAG: T9SS type A sorting domain-containing protein, partial [Candidatus Kapaibacterium sp.]
KDSVSISVCFHPPQPAYYTSEIYWGTDIDASLCTGTKSQSFLTGNTFPKSSVQTSTPSVTAFSLRPNPASGNSVTISFSEELSEPVALSVYDVLGREVYRNQVAPDLKEFDIPIRDLSEGIYYVRIELNGKTVTEKFVKVK